MKNALLKVSKRSPAVCAACCSASSRSQSTSAASTRSSSIASDAPATPWSTIFSRSPASSSKDAFRDPSASSASLPKFTDPLKLVGKELGVMRSSIQSLLGSRHPALDTLAKYYFTGAEAKHIRPMIVLLMAQATNGLCPHFDEIWRKAFAIEKRTRATIQNLNTLHEELDHEAEARLFDEGVRDVNSSISPEHVLQDINPEAPRTILRPLTSSSSSHSTHSSISQAIRDVNDDSADSLILPSQRRLAEIIEMIHVASLLHDDVIDHALARRSQPSSPALFGNKLSILGGDFLLARASLYLSRLGSNEVVEVIASVLANLVEGEVMQMKGNTPLDPDRQSDSSSSPSATFFNLFRSSSSSSSTSSHLDGPTPEIFEYYMTKTHLKTASLMAKSARASVVLGGNGIQQGWAPGEVYKSAAYSYGKNIGIAFQIVDDMLDFTSNSSILGKPSSGADLKLGLATAPTLYAWQEFPEMGPLIRRKFENEGDVELAQNLVLKSSGLEKSKELAKKHAEIARQVLTDVIPESPARDALESLTNKVLSRVK